jgi:hypothetical protein
MSELSDVVLGFSLLQYGAVMPWGRTIPNAEGAALPAGEGEPPVDHWLELLAVADDEDERAQILARAPSATPSMGARTRAWRTRSSCCGPAARCARRRRSPASRSRPCTTRRGWRREWSDLVVSSGSDR